MSSEKEWVQPRFGKFEVQRKNGPNPSSVSSKFRERMGLISAGSKFRERMGPSLVWQVR